MGSDENTSKPLNTENAEGAEKFPFLQEGLCVRSYGHEEAQKDTKKIGSFTWFFVLCRGPRRGDKPVQPQTGTDEYN